MQISYIAKSRGFSLIELMVVMAIMAVLMGLTGGLVTRTVAQQERQVEVEKVKHLFKQLSYQAFYQGSAIDVEFQGNQIKVISTDEEKILSFNQLVFVAQQYRVSTQAVVSPTSFGVFWNEQIRNFPIDSLFETYVGLVDEAA